MWKSLRAAFGVLLEIEMSAEDRLEIVTLLFDNESLRGGHAEKQARWQDLLAPLIEPRLPVSEQSALAARAIAAAAITCLQPANEERVRLCVNADVADLYARPYGRSVARSADQPLDVIRSAAGAPAGTAGVFGRTGSSLR